MLETRTTELGHMPCPEHTHTAEECQKRTNRKRKFEVPAYSVGPEQTHTAEEC